MSAETFAANLRAEMGRQKLTLKAFAERHSYVCSEGFTAGWLAEYWSGLRLPDPAFIETLAKELGCPVERLTVSREELEAELERLRAWRSSMIDAFEEAFTHDDYFIFDILRDAYNKLESEAQP